MKVVATQRGTKGAAEDQTLTFRRELSQVSLHRVDDHRRQSDDAHAGRRLRRASCTTLRTSTGDVALVERQLIGGEGSYWACVPSSLVRPGDVSPHATSTGARARP